MVDSKENYKFDLGVKGLTIITLKILSIVFLSINTENMVMVTTAIGV